MTFMPPGLSDMLHDSLAKLRDLMARLFEEVAKVILNPGWPPGLFSTGSEWTSRIGGPMSSLSTKLSPDQLRIDNFWKGPAADAYAYAKILPAQQKALEAIKQATDVIDTNLTKAAWGIIALWLGIIAAFVAYLLELSLGLIQHMSDVDLPFTMGIAAAIGAVFPAVLSGTARRVSRRFSA
ncbi:hypothetical protein EDD30_3247 [Couchioplanes caeruleus]|nr:hypothetical protein EDD30_3247 [Couchioplanes caeruleus]